MQHAPQVRVADVELKVRGNVSIGSVIFMGIGVAGNESSAASFDYLSHMILQFSRRQGAGRALQEQFAHLLRPEQLECAGDLGAKFIESRLASPLPRHFCEVLIVVPIEKNHRKGYRSDQDRPEHEQ